LIGPIALLYCTLNPRFTCTSIIEPGYTEYYYPFGFYYTLEYFALEVPGIGFIEIFDVGINLIDRLKEFLFIGIPGGQLRDKRVDHLKNSLGELK
jgi:hypothetical protein